MEKEEKEKLNVHLEKHIGKYLILAVIFAFFAPYIFTQTWLGKVFNFGANTGPIGDTIGGITAPIIGFLSAILVYLAFKAQIKANEIQMKAIEKQTKDNAKAIELQEKAIKQQAQDNAEANRLQLETIKQQAEENAFIHEKTLMMDMLKDLSQLMNDKSGRYTLQIPQYGKYEDHGRNGRIWMAIDKYTKEPGKGIAYNLAIQKDTLFSELFISQSILDENEPFRREHYSGLTNQITTLVHEMYSFIFIFQIIQTYLSKKNSERKRIIVISFGLVEKTYLQYYGWLKNYVKEEFNLGIMVEDGTSNYARLKERVDLVEKEYDTTRKLIYPQSEAKD